MPSDTHLLIEFNIYTVHELTTSTRIPKIGILKINTNNSQLMSMYHCHTFEVSMEHGFGLSVSLGYLHFIR